MSHPAATHHTDLRQRALEAPAGGMLTVGGVLAVIGFGLFLMLLAGGDPGRAWRSFHINFLFFTGLSASLFTLRVRLTGERVAACSVIVMGIILLIKGARYFA